MGITSIWGQLVAHALVDDSFMFLPASCENLEKGKLVRSQFPLASRLHIYWRKSSLISYIERDLEWLRWHWPLVGKGSICQHLGYPLDWILQMPDCLNEWFISQGISSCVEIHNLAHLIHSPLSCTMYCRTYGIFFVIATMNQEGFPFRFATIKYWFWWKKDHMGCMKPSNNP